MNEFQYHFYSLASPKKDENTSLFSGTLQVSGGNASSSIDYDE